MKLKQIVDLLSNGEQLNEKYIKSYFCWKSVALVPCLHKMK